MWNKIATKLLYTWTWTTPPSNVPPDTQKFFDSFQARGRDKKRKYYNWGCISFPQPEKTCECSTNLFDSEHNTRSEDIQINTFFSPKNIRAVSWLNDCVSKWIIQILECIICYLQPICQLSSYLCYGYLWERKHNLSFSHSMF